MSTDDIYRQQLRNIEDFAFDKNVSAVFEDMIDRSVPGYRTLIANIGPIAKYFLQSDTNCYDLGCSHGAATLSIYNAISDRSIQFLAIDNAPAMIEKCRQNISKQQASASIRTQLSDIQDIKIENASFVLLNLTLQFVPLEQRQRVIEGIYQGLNKGGACLLTEKVVAADPETDRLLQELHENFKSANDYSQLEISQKRKALENVLLRESIASHQQRFYDAGFTLVTSWFQCMNFVSMIAVK